MKNLLKMLLWQLIEALKKYIKINIQLIIKIKNQVFKLE